MDTTNATNATNASKGDDLRQVLTALKAIDARLARLEAKSQAGSELLEEMTPIGRDVMKVATEKLDELDRKGYFAFGKELVGVGERIVEGFTPDDVRRLGDAVVSILETVRAMTQPHVLQIAADATAALENADQAEPMGMFGMMRATRDEDVQKGIAVMMDVMRHVGKVAKAVAATRRNDPRDAQREKLAAALGPRRKKATGVERTPPRLLPASTSAPAACSTPAKPPDPAKVVVLDGIAFGPDGHMADASAWSEALAPKLAAAHGIELDEARWRIVRAARADFEKTGAAPNIRRLTAVSEVSTKDIYALFPKAPARTVAKIAGTPKPAGCI